MINRFAENFSIEHHGGIGAQHAERFVRHDAAAPGLGLAARQTLDIGRRGLLIYRSFIDVRTDGGELNADRVSNSRRRGEPEARYNRFIKTSPCLMPERIN